MSTGAPTISVLNPSDSKRSAWYSEAMCQLVEVVQELSLARDLASVMDIVRRAARDLTGADGATFVLRDGEQCYYAEENAISPLWKGRRFPMSLCISGWVMLNKRSTVIPDIFQDPRIPIDAYRPTFVRSLTMVPIRTRDPVGAIGNYWAETNRPTVEQVAVLQALADTTAVAMENVRVYAELEDRVKQRTAELEDANSQLRKEIAERERAEEEVRRLAVSDELTGLYNRRGFMTFGSRDYLQARRSQQRGLVLFADIDGLKRTNDTHGHEAGDRMIVAAANVMKSSFRETDVVARLGGDEFAVFIHGSNENEQQLLDRVNANMELIRRNIDVPLAISIGVVECKWDKDESFEGLLRQADEAMYAVKRTARTSCSSLPSFHQPAVLDASAVLQTFSESREGMAQA